MRLRIALLGLLGLGCVSPQMPYERKNRIYELPVPHPSSEDGRPTGSLFGPNSLGTRLLSDERALGVNDLVVVEVDEYASATQGTATETSRTDQYKTTLKTFLTMAKYMRDELPALDEEDLLDLSQENAFKGAGKTARDDRIKATIPAMVRQVLPNGNLFIEGHRALVVNKETNHFYISGVIRPRDIDGEGVVASSRMADAEIEMVGRGNVTNAASKGWFSELLDFFWPF